MKKLSILMALPALLAACTTTYTDPEFEQATETTVVTGTVTVAGLPTSGVVAIAGRTNFGGIESFENTFSRGSYRIEGLFSPSTCGGLSIVITIQDSGGQTLAQEQRLLLSCGIHEVNFAFD